MQKPKEMPARLQCPSALGWRASLRTKTCGKLCSVLSLARGEAYLHRTHSRLSSTCPTDDLDFDSIASHAHIPNERTSSGLVHETTERAAPTQRTVAMRWSVCVRCQGTVGQWGRQRVVLVRRSSFLKDKQDALAFLKS